MTTEESRHSGWLAALDRWLGAAFLRGPMAVGAGWSGRRGGYTAVTVTCVVQGSDAEVENTQSASNGKEAWNECCLPIDLSSGCRRGPPDPLAGESNDQHRLPWA